MSAVKTQVTTDVSELSPEEPDPDQSPSLPEDDTLSFPHDISPSVALVPYFAELICSEGISEKVFALRFDALKMLQGLIHHYDERGYSDTLLNGIAEKKGAMEQFQKASEFLTNFEYSNGAYCMLAPRKPDDLIEEGRQLSHCVGSYTDRVAALDTFIFFLRRTSDPDRSLVMVARPPLALYAANRRGAQDLRKIRRNRVADAAVGRTDDLALLNHIPQCNAVAQRQAALLLHRFRNRPLRLLAAAMIRQNRFCGCPVIKLLRAGLYRRKTSEISSLLCASYNGGNSCVCSS